MSKQIMNKFFGKRLILPLCTDILVSSINHNKQPLLANKFEKVLRNFLQVFVFDVSIDQRRLTGEFYSYFDFLPIDMLRIFSRSENFWYSMLHIKVEGSSFCPVKNNIHKITASDLIRTVLNKNTNLKFSVN